MRRSKKFFLLVLVSFLFLPYGLQVNASIATASGAIKVREDYSIPQNATNAASSMSITVNQRTAGSFQKNLIQTIQGGHQMLQVSSVSNSASFTRHLMCKDHDSYYNPINPTTIFKPSDTKAECLTTVSINNTIEFRWYYRSNSSKTWVSCYNWTDHMPAGEYRYASHLLIAGYWPGTYYPRAYKVDVYLDGSLSFSEFFEVTNGGLNSPRICEDVDENGRPVNMKSRFTIGVDTKAYHYLRFDKIAYFNEELEYCHNFTTVWIQPNGNTYKTYSGSFTDYKDANITWDYWKHGYAPYDYIFINSSTPVGDWKVEVYLDIYHFNSTWVCYGPVATTPFIVGSETVADWTFMVYLDADNSLENAGVDIFLKMANVGSSSRVNVIAQMDRIPGHDSRYGNWTDCKRFYVTKDMTPTSGNATLQLGEANMGHPDTLKNFVNWTMYYYPANYYFLVLWDHGTGCMGVCYDFTDGSDALSLPELRQALSGLSAMIDVVLIDACGMSMIEVAYEIKDYANVLVGPEGLGYGPPPYDYYLSSVTSNSSMSPSAFARDVVTKYINWCMPIANIENATMSAIDLTKITSLMAAIDDFVLKLKEKETLYHDQISLARNLTEGYPGPYAGQSGYYIDLYHFAQLTYQHVVDEELQNAAYQIITALSIGNAIIIEAEKALPNSHGLAIFFPDEKKKYDSFGSVYEKTTFAVDTLWDEFVQYHLSLCILTIQTPYYGIQVKVNQESYTTDAYGRIRLPVLQGYYIINVTTTFLIGLGSRGVFTQWNDKVRLNPRTFFVNISRTLEAEYETQYRLIINTNFGTTNPLNGTEHWYKAGSSVEIKAVAPSVTFGEKYDEFEWIGTGDGSYSGMDNPRYISMNGPINETARWKHKYQLTVVSSYASPTPTNGFFEAGTSITASVTSPVSDPDGTTRYVCIGWNGNGSVPISGTNASMSFTIDKPSNIVWNWKIQYLLVIRTDPTGLSPLPGVSPQGFWYDSGTSVNCTALEISGYVFDYWSVEGVNWERGINSITVTVNRPYEGIAHYVRPRPWWEALLRPEVLQVILGLVGITLTVVFVIPAWIRNRRRKGAMKVLLNEINDVYSRYKTNHRQCEEELYRLKNTILHGWLTDGKISEEDYNIIDKTIDRCVEELRKQKRRKSGEK